MSSTAASRVQRGRGTSRLTPAGVALTVVVVALLFALAVPLRSLLQQRSQMAQLEHQEQVLQRQNEVLETQVRQLNDPAYLERLARQCLGMVKPGEIPFVVVPKGGSGATGGWGADSAGSVPAPSQPGGC